MLTDRNLIHQTLKGDARAFDTLVQKYQSMAYARARLIVQNPQDAEDLTQEVFIKAYQNLPKLRDTSRFAGWLSQIVRNVCMTWLHQQKEISKPCPMDEDPMLSLPSTEATPEQFLMKKELNQTILTAINSLPAVDGAVAHDFYIDDLSYDEISEEHGLSHRAIASRLHRAKQRIAEKVKRSLSAFGIFWKDWGTSILNGMKIMSTVSRSWSISFAIHLGLASIVGGYLVTQSQPFKDLTGVEISQPANLPTKPQVRKPVIKPIQKPEVPIESAIIVEPVKAQPRTTNVAVVRTATVRWQTVSAISNQALKLNAPVNPNVPKVINPHAPVPQVVTHTDAPVSDASDALAWSSPVGTGTGKNSEHTGRGSGAGKNSEHMGRRSGGDGRGISGGTVQVRITDVFESLPGLTMVEEVGTVRDALEPVVDGVRLGNLEVPPLPRGEPGGRVVGRGRDIRGVLRFTRVRHSLSDWWADASALNAFTKWLNEKTQIRTDMNVEGGALKFTDANLHKAPLLFMTGHDPALTRSKIPMGCQYGAGKLDNRLSQTEAAALRRYLVEKGGFLIFDDCGFNAVAQSMTHLFLSNMRHIMPEYHVGRIPNSHEIYHNFYQMGGPPIGFDIYHHGGSLSHFRVDGRPYHLPSRNFLEGIFIGDKLSVLVIHRDYMCAMEAVSSSSRPVHYSPGVYRFMTNVAIYALTHGKISDYSGYVPEDKLAQQRIPTRAPQAARIGAVE